MLETPSLATGSARFDCATQAVVRATDGTNVRLVEFVAGEENRAAVAAVEWLLEDGNAAASSGTLVLHGPSGVGKTLLLRGLVQTWSARRAGETVEFITGAEWNEAYVAAVDGNQIREFRRRFRECDLLVIDDLHRLGLKPAAQTELIATLDALENRGTAVAVALQNAPAKTDELQAGLVARLNGGTVIEVAPPSMMTRRTILGEMVCRRGWAVEITALEMLAADRSRGMSETIGTLLQWHQAATAEGASLDAAFARKHTTEHSAAGPVPSLRTIAEQTAKRFSLTLADLKSESRRRTIVIARDTAVLLMRRMTKKSLQEIGDYFGGRDHTTVMHSCRKAEAALDADTEARTLFTELQQAIERSRSG